MLTTLAGRGSLPDDHRARRRRHRPSPHLADHAPAARGRRGARARLPLRGAGDQLARRPICPIPPPATSRSTSTRPRSAAAWCPRSASSATSKLVLRGPARRCWREARRERDCRGHVAARAARPRQGAARGRGGRDGGLRAAADPSDARDPRGARHVPAREHGRHRCRRAGAGHGRRLSLLQGVRAALADRAVELLRHGLCGLRAAGRQARRTRTGRRSASSATARSR